MESDNDTELLNAIESLPQHLRSAALMRILNNHSYAEISKQLCITQENARKRVQLAREILNKPE